MEYLQIGGFIIALYGAFNAWRANRRIDLQESLNVVPDIDDSAGDKILALRLKIQNPLPEVVRITRIDVSPAMLPQQVMDGIILPQPTSKPMRKIDWDESIKPNESAPFILYFDEEKRKLEQYSLRIHYRTSRGKKRVMKQSFSRGYLPFK